MRAGGRPLQRKRGSTFDVIDLRSIFPYDWQTIPPASGRPGRILIVNEDTEVTNFGEHLLRRVIDEHFYDLLVRPRVLMGKHVPGIGLNPVYEQNTVPQLPQVKAAMEAVARRRGVNSSGDAAWNFDFLNLAKAFTKQRWCAGL